MLASVGDIGGNALVNFFPGRTMVRAGAVPIKAGTGEGRQILKSPGQASTDSKGQNIRCRWNRDNYFPNKSLGMTEEL